jgi:hypothetical protein
MSLLKGLAFVAVSAFLLYSIIRRNVRDTFDERDSYRERLRDLSVHANDIVFLVGEDARILEANDRAVSAYGYSIGELCRKGIIDLMVGKLTSGIAGTSCCKMVAFVQKRPTCAQMAANSRSNSARGVSKPEKESSFTASLGKLQNVKILNVKS